MSIALEGLKEDGYRIGDLQALRYDRTQAPFCDGYLARLYELCRDSRRRSGDGILTTLFNGNPASTFDAFVSFLAPKPIVVMGEWKDDAFHEAGFAFPVVTCGVQAPELSCFAGYGFFRHAWGTPELPVLAMLGLSFMFQEWNVKAIHGTRYEDNVLTSRFLRQFGFTDIGRIPDYQLREGKLVPAIVSTLNREDFERYVEVWLVEQYRAEMALEPPAPPVTVPEPRKEEEPPQLPLNWL